MKIKLIHVYSSADAAAHGPGGDSGCQNGRPRQQNQRLLLPLCEPRRTCECQQLSHYVNVPFKKKKIVLYFYMKNNWKLKWVSKWNNVKIKVLCSTFLHSIQFCILLRFSGTSILAEIEQEFLILFFFKFNTQIFFSNGLRQLIKQDIVNVQHVSLQTFDY